MESSDSVTLEGVVLQEEYPLLETGDAESKLVTPETGTDQDLDGQPTPTCQPVEEPNPLIDLDNYSSAIVGQIVESADNEIDSQSSPDEPNVDITHAVFGMLTNKESTHHTNQETKIDTSTIKVEAVPADVTCTESSTTKTTVTILCPQQSEVEILPLLKPKAEEHVTVCEDAQPVIQAPMVTKEIIIPCPKPETSNATRQLTIGTQEDVPTDIISAPAEVLFQKPNTIPRKTHSGRRGKIKTNREATNLQCSPIIKDFPQANDHQNEKGDGNATFKPGSEYNVCDKFSVHTGISEVSDMCQPPEVSWEIDIGEFKPVKSSKKRQSKSIRQKVTSIENTYTSNNDTPAVVQQTRATPAKLAIQQRKVLDLNRW